MLSDFTGAEKVFIACGYTDLRRGIDGLASIIQQQFSLDPFTNTLFLFCGRRRDRLKALYWENYGLGLATNTRSAYDITDNALRLTVLRSPAFADHCAIRDGLMEYTEQGEQSFSIALTPVTDDYTAIYHLSENMLNAPTALLGTYHKGELGSESSVLNIDCDNVVVTAFKTAEDGNGYILRCHEITGKAVSAKIEIPALNVNSVVDFGVQEIKTFRIIDGSLTETDFTEK